MEILEKCPFCEHDITSGTLEGLGLSHETVEEVRRLREEGKLTQLVFLAVKIVRTVQDNPQWVKELLDEQSTKLSSDLRDSFEDGKSQILKELHELMGSPQRGKIQEVSITKRLKTAVPNDAFNPENSTRKGEDIECTVLENNDVAGTIVFESKNVKSWSRSFIEQVKQYMSKRGTEFGIVATTAMPGDALSHSVMIDGVLVVKADYVEFAYLFMREYLTTKAQLERDYQSKISQLKLGEEVIQELRNVINSGGLNQIIAAVTADIDNIDSLVNSALDYIQTFANRVKKKTGQIRSQVSKLMSDHIEVIRAKLESKTV